MHRMNVENYSKLKPKYDELIDKRVRIADNLRESENELADVNEEIEKTKVQLLNVLKDMKAEIHSDDQDNNVAFKSDDDFKLTTDSTSSQPVGGNAISEDETEDLADAVDGNITVEDLMDKLAGSEPEE